MDSLHITNPVSQNIKISRKTNKKGFMIIIIIMIYDTDTLTFRNTCSFMHSRLQCDVSVIWSESLAWGLSSSS